jgi:Ser/Thr protein kinase RdoA (MazF antagonist)
MNTPSPALVHTAHVAAKAFGLHPTTLETVTFGHINTTFVVTVAGTKNILQRVNPLFAPEANLDIAELCEHLRRAGLVAPTLARTLEGFLWFTDPDGGVWRLMDYIEGQVIERCTEPSQARAAARVLGRFHRALSHVTHTFHTSRVGVHDTQRHVQGLADALEQHRGHTAYAAIAPLAHELLDAAQKLPPLESGRPRIVHGDPKISNFIFDADHEARALIDLDTMAHMPIAFELGDALRSWCNPGGEDPAGARFELSHFEAALEGYHQGAGAWLDAKEVAALVPALEVIAIKLAVRFARDALEERYFNWDQCRYARAWEHNLNRAQSQWALATSYAAQRHAAARSVAQIFGLTV